MTGIFIRRDTANNKMSEKGIKKIIYNGIKNNKIIRNKFNKEGERSIRWKSSDFDERNWRKYKQMKKISCVYELEELVLLKSYYAKPSIDLVPSLSKFQWYILCKWKK